MHSSFGLRYLRANLKDLRESSEIIEFVLGKNPRDIVESLLELQPKIVGLGVYIWNTTVILEVVSLLKRVAPDVVVVLGGPEISHNTEEQELFREADFVIRGEADFLFYDFCKQILSGEKPAGKLISGDLPQITDIKLPYAEYTDQDVAHRVIYVEASRGCPYKCEYCLSSLDKSVRNFPIDHFLEQMQSLIDRGVRQFKFVDRTFNLSPQISTRILQFFLDQIQLGLFLHFELVPDRLPDELKDLIRKFPKGSLQFEIGVQTWNPQVAANVSRRQNYTKIGENFKFLREETGVHTHADLIVGLPGESAESFAAGFDALAANGPDEIQVGILKRLKGTPIVRHDQEFKMLYSPQPPFQLLSNRDLTFAQMQKFQRFSQFWDLVANSGNFPLLMPFLRQRVVDFEGSLFSLMWDLSDFLFARHGQAHSIARTHLAESLMAYLCERFGLAEVDAQTLVVAAKVRPAQAATPARQRRHQVETSATSRA